MIYDGGKKIDPNNTSQDYNRSTITGVGTTFDHRTNRSVLIMGQNSTYTSTHTSGFSSGVTLMGSWAKITAPELPKNNESNVTNLAIDGLVLCGSNTDVWTETAFNDDNIQNSERYGGKGIHIRGVGVFGTNSTIATRDNNNEGLILGGALNVVKAHNNSGVIIVSRPSNVSYYDYINNNRQDTVQNPEWNESTSKRRTGKVEGIGIYIAGSGINLKEKDDHGNNISYNSTIQGSTVANLPTILEGNFQLGSNFTLKDKDGKTIIFQNGLLKTSN